MNSLLSLYSVLEQALPPGSPSRREFIAKSGSAMGGVWLLGLLQACDSAGSQAARAVADGAELDGLETLDDREGADFEAFSALIIPSDTSPGAREAGTVYFADRALGSFMQFLAPVIQDGLADMADRARGASGAAGGFADLDEAAQLTIMREVETDNAGFFGAARLLVLLGLSSDPEYGGNRGKVGWRLLGFHDQFQHEPPFGGYDIGEHGGSAS